MQRNQKVFLRLKNKAFSNKKSIKYDGNDYLFDGVVSASQKDFFDIAVKDLIHDFIRGYNCTILAYGQTGSGKTYTIQGTPQDAGILQRSLFLIFDSCIKSKIEITYTEIYNESVYDLFSCEERKEISTREDPEKGIYYENITIKRPKTYEECIDFVQRGIQERKTARTNMNIESSRSHSLFTVHLETERNSLKTKSKLQIVDLAGSERTDSRSSENRVRESGQINRSLLCLSQVIEKLSRGEGFVNYRDSRLTLILKDCLGGNSKIAVIGNINSSVRRNENDEKENIDTNKVLKCNKEDIKNECTDSIKRARRNENIYETINTLNFLCKVKRIENDPVINSEINGDIEDIKREYKALLNEHEILKNSKQIKQILRTDNTCLKMKLSKITKDLQRIEEEYKLLKKASIVLILSNKKNSIIEYTKIDKIYKKLIDENEKNINLDTLL